MTQSYYVDPTHPDYQSMMDAGYASPLGDYDDASGFFDSIVSAVSSVARTVAAPVSAVGGLISQGTHLLQQGLGALTNNPLWDIARTGVSFIPGVGTAVSAGMAGAAALGRGESIQNIGLAAARGALPGGAVTQAAFDAAIGLAKGKNVTDAILQAARNQVPGGDVGKAAFDAASAIAKGQALSDIAINAIRARVPGGALGKQAFNTAIDNFRKSHRAAPIPSFPSLGLAANRAARAIQGSPALQRVPVRQLAIRLGTAPSNIQQAIAALLRQYGGGTVSTGDVGAFDTVESCCEREGISIPSTSDYDTGAFYPSDLWGSPIPRVRLSMSAPFMHGLLRHSATPVRMGILAHGLIPRLYHQTGELDQKGGWIIRSGEGPFVIAQKLTGNGNRWREILAVNPTLKVKQVGSTTQVTPFNPGQRITIPASWLGTAAPSPTATVPLPIPTTIAIPGLPSVSIPTAIPLPTPSDVGAQPTLKQGDSGPGVKRWQALLLLLGSQIITQADGQFGPLTDKATRAYQSARGLVSDGVVGPKTWATAMTEAATKSAPSSPTPTATPAAPPILTPGGPMIPSTTNQPLIASIQAMLAFFYQHHGSEVGAGDFSSSSTPRFGSSADDLTGTWTDRSKEAMLGFQNWRNAHPVMGGTPIPEDGQPDQNSVNALQAQNARDLASVGTAINLPELPTVIPANFPIPGSAGPIAGGGAPLPNKPPAGGAAAGSPGTATGPTPIVQKAGVADSGGGGGIIAVGIVIAILASLASQKGARGRAA